MAPAEDDISIEEKRVYAGSAGRTDAYVATESGVIRVALSADKIGAFDMIAREPARGVAVLPRRTAPDLLGVATDDGLLVAPVGDDLAFEPVEVAPAPAVAVGVHDGGFLVADADGEIDRVAIGSDAMADAAMADDAIADETTATRIGSVPDPRAIDGPLVAAADGVHRVGEGDAAESGRGLVAVGLDDARDVAGSGMPLAATADGLYWLGNGWMPAREGDAEAVAADGDGHAMAVVDGDLLVHADDTERGSIGWEPETWSRTDLPVDERTVSLGYGPGLSVAVTAAGTLCVDAGDGWRHQVVGVRGVTDVALAAVE